MIILTPRISRNASGSGPRSVIKFPHADDRPRTGEQIARISSNLRPTIRQVTHLPCEAFFDPFAIARKIPRWLSRGNPGELESALARQLLHRFALHAAMVT